MNKKVIIYLGGILLLIIIIVGFILFLNNRSKTVNTVATQTQTTQPTTTTSTSTGTTTATTGTGITATGTTGTNTTGTTGTQTTGTTGATSTTSRLTKVSGDPVIAPILDLDAGALWYFTADGSSYKVRLDNGLKQEFLLPDKQPITDAIWPRSGSDFILVSGTAAGRTFRYLNSTASGGPAFTAYPANIKGVDFAPSSQSIFYNWVSADGTSKLSKGTLIDDSHTDIMPLPEGDLNIQASNAGDRILAYNQDSPKNGKLYLIFVNTKKIITLPTAVDNSAIWAPDGTHFLYNRNDDGTGTGTDLWLGDSNSKNDVDLHIASSVNKAAFDFAGSFLYVAAPDPTSGSDVIWKIDLKTFQKTKIFAPNATDTPSTISATHLMISGDRSQIFFENSDGYVYGFMNSAQ